MALSNQFVSAFAEASQDLLLAQVARAIAGVDIFGLTPFDFLNGWATDLENQASTAINNASMAQTTANTAQSTANTANSTANSAQSTATSAQTTANTANTGVQITQSNLNAVQATIPTTSSLHISLNPSEDSTFPWTDLGPAVRSIGGGPGSTTFYDSAGNSVAVTYDQGPFYTTALGRLEGGFIRASNDRSYGSLSFAVGAATTPCQLYGVFGRALANGDIAIDYVSANQTPLISTGAQLVTVTAPTDTAAAGGGLFWGGVLQLGTGNLRPIAGRTLSGISRNPSDYPPQPGFNAGTFGSVPTAGTTIAKASLNFGSYALPWIALGSRPSAAPAAQSYYDSFARPNANDLGGNWSYLTVAAPHIASNVAMLYPSYDSTAYALWNYQVSTDVVQVSATLGNTPTSLWDYLILQSDNTGANRVQLAVNASTIQIQTVASGTATTVATVSRTQAKGDAVAVQVGTGGVYNVFVNSVNVLNYTNASITTGAGHRYPGIGVSSQQSSSSQSAGWQQWRAADV